MTDVLLINAPVKKLCRHARLSPPLGIGYIAAVLFENGYDVSAVDLNISGSNPARVNMIVEREAPKVLGISANTQSYLNGLEIASIAKRVEPELPVVIGGPHPTVMYEDAAREASVDLVVRGEGELTMLELAESLLNDGHNLEDINGIAYEEDGRLKVNPERSFVKDPDDLPFPARELFPLHLYPYPAGVLMSRGGCPFRCRFCAVNNIWKGKRRFRAPEKVAQEVLFVLKEFGVDRIDFVDDTFTLNRSQVLGLCQHLRHVRAPLPWGWTCSTRVDLVDEELLREMYEAGCMSVQYGVEAGSQEILDSMGKGVTIEQVVRAVRMAKDEGMDVICSFMFPHPEDTVETIQEQKRFMKELSDMGVDETMSCTIPYPGTYYYEHAEQLGIEIVSDSWDEFHGGHVVMTTKDLSKRELERLFEELIRDLGLREA